MSVADQIPEVAANQALEQLRGWIGARQMLPGSRLPAERELARRLGVTRFVVRAALVQLEADGLIRSASERIRVVADGASRSPSVMAETVALLTHLRSRPIPGEEGPARMVQMLYLGISEALQQAGLNVLTVPPERAALPRIQRLIAQRPLGLIVLDDGLNDIGRSVLAEACAQGLPAVVHGDVLDETMLAAPAFDVVSSDQRGGSHALTRWLIGRGCRRPARFSDSPDARRAAQVWRARREQGYRDACHEAGIEPVPTIEALRHTGHDGGRAAFDQQVRVTAGFLLEHLRGARPLDALLVVSDGLTFDVAAACRLLGRPVGEGLALVGYDNYWAGAPERRWEPTVPAATVDKNLHEVGTELVRMLVDRASGRLPAGSQQRIVPSQLIVD